MVQDASVMQMIHAWTAEIGRPYTSSWVNTVLYACALVVVVKKWRDLRHAQATSAEQRLWAFCFFVLLVLGINKQLNFQSLLIQLGRYFAQYGDWSEKRRLVQAWFAYTLSGLMGGTVLFILIATRRLWQGHALALIGLGILFIYVVIRATSICHVGFVAEAYSEGNFRLTDMIEFFGVLFVFIDACRAHRKA
jgi:hypothetical protein